MNIDKAVSLQIDGLQVTVPKGVTILGAADKLKIKIPTLCNHPKLRPVGACRLCHVEVSTAIRKEVLLPACATLAEDGMIITTNTKQVIAARRFILALLLAQAPLPPKLVELAREHGVVLEENSADPLCRFLHHQVEAKKEAFGEEHSSWCITCGLCVRVCAEIVGRNAIGTANRGPDKRIVTPFKDISEVCIGCNSCAYVCPTEAISISEAES